MKRSQKRTESIAFKVTKDEFDEIHRVSNDVNIPVHYLARQALNSKIAGISHDILVKKGLEKPATVFCPQCKFLVSKDLKQPYLDCPNCGQSFIAGLLNGSEPEKDGANDLPYRELKFELVDKESREKMKAWFER